MYSLIFAAALSFSASMTSPGIVPTTPAPTPEAFATEGIDVLHLVCEKKGSDVSITLLLQIDETVLSLSSESYSYVEASQNLKEVIADITNQ